MEAIILAGGFGTRLKEVISDRPKPLAPIQGVPFLDLLLAQLKGHVTKVILAVGYKADDIIARYEASDFPFAIVFSRETKPLGTGGALKKAAELATGEDLLVLNGDSYLHYSFAQLWQMHETKQAAITIAATTVPEANRYGLLSIDKTTGQVLNFLEKQVEAKTGTINGGVYIIKKSLLASCEEVFSLEKDFFPLWLNKTMYACSFEGLFIDIGTPDSWNQAQTLLKEII